MAYILSAPQPVGEFSDSTDLLSHPGLLRQAYEEQGYLFFRHLLPEEALYSVRRDILSLCSDAGWLHPDSEIQEGRVAPDVGPYFEGVHQEYASVYDQIQLLESFHSLPHHSNLARLFEALFDEQPLIHPRNIARLIFPNATQETTPPHQDFVHIGGTPDTATAWIPLGDCPEKLGGLIVLEGSHKVGELETVPARGAGGRGILTDNLDLPWKSSPFSAGDVLIFHSLTVHAGRPNRSADHLRVSVDIRAQAVSEPVRYDSLLPHMNRVSWEEIYSGWKNTKLQYYWRNLPLEVVGSEEDNPLQY